MPNSNSERVMAETLQHTITFGNREHFELTEEQQAILGAMYAVVLANERGEIEIGDKIEDLDNVTLPYAKQATKLLGRDN